MYKKTNRKKNKERYKRQHDSRIALPPRLFEPGDLVKILNTKENKLSPEWKSPATIIKFLPNNNYEILFNNERIVVHANRLKEQFQIFFLMMFLAATSTVKITKKPLQDVTVFVENLEKTKPYHRALKVIIVIDSQNLYDRLHQVDRALEYAQDQCKGDCYENAEIKLLTRLLDRLKLLYSHLYHTLG